MIWRPISVLVTLIYETTILGIEASCTMKTSVVAMLGGAVIAFANGDEVIMWSYYVLILLNSLHLAAFGVISKGILDSKVCGACGLIYIDTLVMVLPTFIITWSVVDLAGLTNYEIWGDPFILGHVLMFSIMGITQSYSVFLCIQHNSALTTSVIGSLICIFKYILCTLLFHGRN